MKFIGSLIFVTDVKASRKFYEGLLGEEIALDIGACQQFKSGLTLQSRGSVPALFGIDIIKNKDNDAILYFETDGFDCFLIRIKEFDVKYLNGMSEPWQYEWGQRAIRFMDPDGYLIEVAESMADVIRRFFAQGLTVEDIVNCTDLPAEYIDECLK